MFHLASVSIVRGDYFWALEEKILTHILTLMKIAFSDNAFTVKSYSNVAMVIQPL